MSEATCRDVDGRPVAKGDRVKVVTTVHAHLIGRVGTVQVTRPASGEGRRRLPASVNVNLDGGPGLDCNADMVRIITDLFSGAGAKW